MQEVDQRIVTVGITVNGQVREYTGLNVRASGTRYANANMNECDLTITNLKADVRNALIQETSPFNSNRTPKVLTLKAGTKSTGTTLIFSGNIYSSKPSQPPDVNLNLKCMTGYFLTGNIVSRTQTGVANLSKISRDVARDLGVPLEFQAQDRQVSNYNFTGSSVRQIDRINDLAPVNAYLDNDILVIKDLNVPLSNQVTIVNMDTGMIGIPELTEWGIKATFLINTQTNLGGTLRVTSKLNPAAKGDYTIYKLGFEITSREDAFYYTAEAIRKQ